MSRLKRVIPVLALAVGLGGTVAAEGGSSQAPKAAGTTLAYKLTDGPHEVVVTDIVLRDEKRGKDLALKIRCPKEQGKYAGRTLESLRGEYNDLKESGPHKEGSAKWEKMKELSFAIRAKTGWGKVSGKKGKKKDE